jgi:hypothetical protein
MLEELGIADDQTLKCSAHILLCIDHALEHTFKEAEKAIGLEKLINCANILKSSSSSLHTSGLIALAKLLSPSHASHTVSLYSEYKDWLSTKTGENGTSFKGFVSNRFGRVLHLSNQYLRHKEYLHEFFDTFVDEHSNKLVLAVHTFLNNAWFCCCSEVLSLIGTLFITPLMELLNIDEHGKGNRCDWTALKIFFDKKMLELESLEKKFAATSTGKGRLIAACVTEIIESVRRQLGAMSFFVDSDISKDFERKLNLAPVTNLGCESCFAELDNRVKVTGGSASVKSHSQKMIVSTNGLLKDTSFTDLSVDDKMSRWHWARSSTAVKEVKTLEKNFIITVKAMKKLAFNKKEELKILKRKRMLSLLDTCKKHGGPITESNIHKVNKLNQAQCVSEISSEQQSARTFARNVE